MDLDQFPPGTQGEKLCLAGDRREKFNQWLWSRQHPEVLEDVEDVADEEEEEGEVVLPEHQGAARYSLSQWTTSKLIPQESSASVRAYRSAQHFQVEYSSPTMSIRSQTYWLHTSRTRPVPQPALSRLKSILPKASQLWGLESLVSPSNQMQLGDSTQARSRGRNGSPVPKISSISSTRGMAVPRSPGSSSSGSQSKTRVRNR